MAEQRPCLRREPVLSLQCGDLAQTGLGAVWLLGRRWLPAAGQMLTEPVPVQAEAAGFQGKIPAPRTPPARPHAGRKSPI